MAACIHCILLNPTIDRIFEVPELTVGTTYNLQHIDIFPVGKAISVALTLSTLGAPVRVLACIGTSEIPLYTEFLKTHGISHRIIPVEGQTRSNITIVDQKSGQSTHFRMPGFQLKSEHLQQLKNYLETEVTAGDYVVFSGSCPLGTPPEFFFDVSPRIAKQRAHLIIDTSGPRLKQLVLYHPLFIKGNLEEISEVIGHSLIDRQEFQREPSDEDLYEIMDKTHELAESDVRFTIITFGKYGALIFNRNAAFYGRIELQHAPYTVGSGDAFMGGILTQMLTSNHDQLSEILRYATACGAANTQTLGAGILKQEDVTRFIPQVSIRQIK
jgi:1-phosphofructokinase family hexose kinase